MLLSFLDSHPSIEAHGEIFNRLEDRDYKDVLKKTFSKKPYYVKAAGFKLFYYHPLDVESCGIWDELVDMKDLHVIHLKRRNILRTLVSRKIAAQQDVWMMKNAAVKNKNAEKAVMFTVQELKDGFEKTRSWEKNGERMFCNHRGVNVYYEDLVGNVEMEFKKITSMLDLANIKPQTNLKRQNPERISELITNYDELKIAFSGGEWESFFED
jgi:hypothetical protein